jgi:phosphoribosyl 1,2-cyclic phosphate phosphodiesterase
VRLLFLGTAASEGFPDAFCDCDNCRRARELGGPSLRKRSSALIDDRLLIDLGPDLMVAAMLHGISLAKVDHCLQTHEHADHLDPTNFLHRSRFCGVSGNPRLRYFASRGAHAKVAAALGRRVGPDGLLGRAAGDAFEVEAHVVEPFSTFEVGPYRVTSVPAFHDPDHLTALLYVIEREGRTLFYATDTGELPEESWRALADGRHRFDVAAMDHTFGFQGRARGHLNAEQFGEQVARMRAEGMLKEGARVFAHHLAHHSHPPHPELSELTRARGYEVAYDGLAVDV